MSKPLVIYHRADFDGIFCREIAKFHMGEVPEYLGWDYGDPVPAVDCSRLVIMMDISIEPLMTHPRLIWIDHHQSAIAKFSRDIVGYRIDGVAACRLAWQWFAASAWQHDFGEPGFELPALRHYVERQVDEPLAVRLAGEYDIWDKRDERAELFQHGLRSAEVDFQRLLAARPCDDSERYVNNLLENGRALQFARTNENKSVIEQAGFTVEFEGLKLIACNSARYNSHLFTAGVKPEHDGCLGFNWNGVRRKWRVSLYGVPDKPDIDLSKIAVKYGGGGHKQACGFECDLLPFSL